MVLHECRIVAAVEDEGTTEAVAMEAALVALEQDVDTVIFIHVLDAHPLVSGLYGMSGVPIPGPIGETEDEGMALLAWAEEVLHAVYAAWGRPAPTTRREIATGDPAVAIARIAGEYDARDIVLGARRPHALGQAFHHDVRAYLTTHSGAHLHVAAPAPPPPCPREGGRSVGARVTAGRGEEPGVLACGGGGGDVDGAPTPHGHGDERERVRRGHGQQQQVVADPQ
jgi:nucleotide-binding universal stress UspA family protein